MCFVVCMSLKHSTHEGSLTGCVDTNGINDELHIFNFKIINRVEIKLLKTIFNFTYCSMNRFFPFMYLVINWSFYFFAKWP